MSVADSDRVLEAFLDETLAPDVAAQLEQRLRDDAELRRRLAAVHAARDRGDYSLGTYWQRGRIACADRATLGAYLLGVLDDDQRRFLEVHLNLVGCRYCRANLDDLAAHHATRPDDVDDARRRKLFDTSVGRLKP